jgi:hypothetical protein
MRWCRSKRNRAIKLLNLYGVVDVLG